LEYRKLAQLAQLVFNFLPFVLGADTRVNCDTRLLR
jgi:hypothetical protein